jgi:hypothetical protein
VTTVLKRLLSLRVDLTEFEQFAAHDDHLSPLATMGFVVPSPPGVPTGDWSTSIYCLADSSVAALGKRMLFSLWMCRCRSVSKLARPS